jgi:vitamin B12 transporter
MLQFAASKQFAKMRLTVTVILILAGFAATAQKTELDLDPVTITATLKPQTNSQTGRNITVITGEQFNRLPVQSVDELLKYVPGVEVQQRGPAGSQADIVLRGGTFQQVLIILDGIRLNDPNTGHFNSYIPIAPAEIKQIEILKGAASAIYGSEAVGGVVHIITKTFAAKQNKASRSFTGAGSAGQYGLWSVNAGGSYQIKNTTLAAGILSNNADGQLQRGTHGFYHNTTASISASHYFNANWQLSLRSAYDRRYFSAQNFYTTFKSDTAAEAVETFWNQATLSYRKGKSAWITDAGFKKVMDKYAFNSGAAANKNFSRLFQTSSRYEHEFSKQASLITGIQFQGRSIRSNDRGNHELDQLAGFMVLNQTIGKHFFFSPAIRIDYAEGTGIEFVPQLNASYKVKQLQLRSSAGTTIRRADFTERFNNYNKVLVTSGSIGNPALEAERSFSYEAGADYFIKKEWKLSATVFRREQSQLVDWITTAYNAMPRKDNLSPAGTYALAQNIAKVNTSGLETDIQYNRNLERERQLYFSMGIVWLDSESSSGEPSFYISSHAKFMSNGTIVYNTPRYSVSVNGIYKTRAAQTASAINATVSKEYFLLNTRVAVFVVKQKASIFGQASNLFNTTYSDLLGAPMPGRWLVAGFNYHL